jgi:hypothetical protein
MTGLMEVWKDKKGKMTGRVEGDWLLGDGGMVVEAVGDGTGVEVESRIDEVVEADVLLEFAAQAVDELVLVARAITGSTVVVDIDTVLLEGDVLVGAEILNVQDMSSSQEWVVKATVEVEEDRGMW